MCIRDRHDTLLELHTGHTRQHRLPPPPLPSLQGYRLLLVEDNDINQQIAVEILESAGAEVAIARNGLEAVHQVLHRHKSFDLVLMDLQMPVMDGYTATQRLRADRRFDALPIVALTAHAMVEEVERCAAPVSYTHLDVYKRQRMGKTPVGMFDCTERKAMWGRFKCGGAQTSAV